jgi:hypothetical protein
MVQRIEDGPLLAVALFRSSFPFDVLGIRIFGERRLAYTDATGVMIPQRCLILNTSGKAGDASEDACRFKIPGASHEIDQFNGSRGMNHANRNPGLVFFGDSVVGDWFHGDSRRREE